MAKDLTLNKKEIDLKVLIFWIMIFAITIVFAVLFVIRLSETRLFKSYEDIEKANLNLVYDIASEKGEYFVYIYSAKKDDNNKLVNTAKCDFVKANDVFPTVLNYFNYVRRNERVHGKEQGFIKIYGYNAKLNDKDANLDSIGVTIEQLPILVKMSGGNGVAETYKTVSEIQKTLNGLMVK